MKVNLQRIPTDKKADVVFEGNEARKALIFANLTDARLLVALDESACNDDNFTFFVEAGGVFQWDYATTGAVAICWPTLPTTGKATCSEVSA